MVWSFVVPALIAAAAVGAMPASAFAGVRMFRSPAGRLGCAFLSGDGAPRQVRCEWQGGGDQALTVHETGKARRIHITDTVRDPRAKVLAYGRSTTFGRLKCASRPTGITCRNPRRGFTVSVNQQRVF